MANGVANWLDDLLGLLPDVSSMHAPTSKLYGFLNQIAKEEANRLFGENQVPSSLTGPLQNLKFPFHKMGNITSLHLFGLDELILFSFYWANRKKYRKAIDLGANIGLHSIALSNCGFEVKCFEPDPDNYRTLVRNLGLNSATSVQPINAAVSTRSGTMDFVRVLGNLTGNHLAGAKTGAYGDLQTISVKVEEFRPLLRWADFAKIDVEGHEKDLILSTEAQDWQNCDAILEVGNEANAVAIFNHLNAIKLTMFSQKNSWAQVRNLADMPTSYRDGSLFITSKREMTWS